MTQLPMETMSENGQSDEMDDTTDNFELGADLLEDIGEVETHPKSEPEPAVTADPVDLDTVDPETLPPELQKMARELKADHTRKTQAIADLRRETQAIRDQSTSDRLKSLETAQTKPDDDPFDVLRSRLSPDEQNAVNVIDEVDRLRNGDFREQTNQKMSQMTAALQRVVQVMVGQAGKVAEAKVVTMRERYPDFDSTAPQRAALVRVANPATGQAYTDEEAHRLVKGLAAEESRQLVRQDQKARRQSTTTPPAPRRASNMNADFSDGELSEGMAELGFG